MDTIIRNATVVNEGQIRVLDVLISAERIEKIAPSIVVNPANKIIEIDATGLYLLPGVIDDQVHFRDPGLTHKGSRNLLQLWRVVLLPLWICQILFPIRLLRNY
jgi:dihydroorotase